MQSASRLGAVAGGCGIAAAVGWASAPAAAQCQPGWATPNAVMDAGVHALASVIDDGGPALYAGGRFTQAGGVTVNRIARFDGHTWQALGSGIPGQFNSHGYNGCCANVHAIAADSTPAGRVVHIAGNFIVAGGVTVESIADYGSGQWQGLAGGVARTGCVDCASIVYGMTHFGGPGPGALYAVGAFDVAGGVSAAKVARWNLGVGSWSAVGEGIGAVPEDPMPPTPQAVLSYRGALYVGGAFSLAGSVPTNSIAAWDGSAWSAVGGGLVIPPEGRRPSVTSMALFDDGRGQALYIAGILDNAGGVEARNIARWNGMQWEALGAGIGSGVNDRVWTLAVFDDGSGPALYAGGEFADAGGVPAANIVRWDGRSWHALGPGADGAVHAMAVFDDGSGASLFIGGWFNNAGGLSSPYLAKWTGCPGQSCYANCDASTVPPVLNIADFVCFISRFAAGDPAANCDGSSVPPTLNIGDFVCFQGRFAAGCP